MSEMVEKPPVSLNTNDLPIAIVGGGLGGLALAIGLLNHNIKVRIYEAATEYSEIGAGVSFGYNSIAALQGIDSRLLDGYKKHVTLDADEDFDTFMRVRWGMDEKRECGRRAGDPIWSMKDIWHPDRAVRIGVRTRSSIHRARLLEELVALLPEGTTSFKKSFQEFEEVAGGGILLKFADGSTAYASALIGCDGIKSKVREAIYGSKIQAKYAGEAAYRALVPMAEAEAALGSVAASNGHIYAGYGGYIVTYPVEHGRLMNLNALIRDPEGAGPWEHDDWTVAITADEILNRFHGWYPPLVELLSRFHLPSKWALFCLQHDEPYYRRRVCLLGDSAHATTPHMGAGAGLAMEDAYILSSLIATLDSLSDIELAFQAYGTVRQPRTQKIIESSLDVGIRYSFRHPVDRDNTVDIKQHIQDYHRQLWHEDLEAELQTAKLFMMRPDTSRGGHCHS